MKYDNLFLATTDTVVGIGGPMNKNTESEIFLLKKRERKKPLLVMVPSIEKAREFKGWNSNAEGLAQEFWPGQLTIVLDSVGIRIPNSKELIDLMEKIGPIYVTSANKSGKPTLSLEEAKVEFPEIKTYYSKTKGTNVASTIIRAKDLKIIRQGIIEL